MSGFLAHARPQQHGLFLLQNSYIVGMKLNIRQRFNALFTGKVPEKRHIPSINTTSSGMFLNNTKAHRVIRLLNECNSAQDEVAGDPRPKLHLYHALEWAFPFLARAKELRTAIIGIPYPDSPDLRIKNLFVDLWEDLAVRYECLTELDSDAGIPCFIERMVSGTFTNGTQPYKIEIDETTGAVIGVRIHDPFRFYYYRPSINDQYQLRYTPEDGGIYRILPTEFFRVSSFDRKQFTWGIPLNYYAEFFADTLTRTIIARRDSHIRIGNPPSFTSISYEPPSSEMLDPDVLNNLTSKAATSATTAATTYKQGLAEMYEKGRPMDIVVTGAGKFSLDQTMFGQGAPGIQGFDSDFVLFASQMAISTGCPRVFLGFSESGGLNSDMVRQQKQIMYNRRDIDRANVEMQVKHLMYLHLLANGASPAVLNNPETYLLAWNEPDLSDAKLMAEADKIEAEALNQQLMNYANLFMEFGNTGNEPANNYAMEINKPSWVK